MKVLKRQPWSLVVDCPSCKSQLEIEASDVIKGYYSCMGETDMVYYVVCMVCNGDIDFGDYYKAKQIPKHIKDSARTKR